MRTAWALTCAVILSSTSVSSNAAAQEPDLAPTSAFFDVPWPTALPQEIQPGTVLVARPNPKRKRARATSRSDQQFFEISSTGSNDVPEAALRAYHHAAGVMSACAIPWTFLAAVGRVESDHGRYGGSQLGSDGVSRPEIIGPRLDGAGPFAAISDSDDGSLDHDKIWDRAVGPMQFIPGTWRMVARDGDGDGSANPHDIDDSALAAAVYLCGAGHLGSTEALARAAFRYNPSDYYVQLVLAFYNGYETGVFSVPSPAPPPAAPDRPRPKSSPAATAPEPSTPSAPSTPKPPPPPPSPSPPPPSPSPAPVASADHTGEWRACDTGYCLGDLVLDLDTSGLDQLALADYDGDGAGTETNHEEFEGLLGRTVTVHGVLDGSTILVQRIDGKDYA